MMGNEQVSEGASQEDPFSSVDVSDLKVWTVEEIHAYNAEQNANLVILHNKVFDVTRFLDEHPGGDEILREYKGQDASSYFDEIGHTPKAIASAIDYLVGVVNM